MSGSPPVRAGWALFNRWLALGDSGNAAAAAVCKTGNGRDISVSLRRLASPPATSCLQLCTDDELFLEPSIVAADGDLLLIHMSIAVKGLPEEQFPPNFFVYKADPDLPCLCPLPAPRDWKTTMSAVEARYTGIVRRGEDGFVVANLLPRMHFTDLTTMSAVEVADLWLYRSATEQWETRRLAMPHDPDKGLEELYGILYCDDVCSPDPELVFLRFPGIEIWDGINRGIPKWYRSVSICRGELKFVDVDNGRFRSTGDDDGGGGGGEFNGSWSSFGDEPFETDECEGSITIWTLNSEHAGLRVEDGDHHPARRPLVSHEAPISGRATDRADIPSREHAESQRSPLHTEGSYILGQCLDGHT
ncbi:hypothetical protein ACP70R_025608 [Stipagrostis hirtigluma subsp. patula]